MTGQLTSSYSQVNMKAGRQNVIGHQTQSLELKVNTTGLIVEENPKLGHLIFFLNTKK